MIGIQTMSYQMGITQYVSLRLQYTERTAKQDMYLWRKFKQWLLQTLSYMPYSSSSIDLENTHTVLYKGAHACDSVLQREAHRVIEIPIY